MKGERMVDAGGPRVRETERTLQRVALDGDAAHGWLRARGYIALDPHRELHLVADELSYDDFVIRRGWFTSLSVIRRPVADRGRVTCNVFLGGESAVERVEETARTTPGTVVFHDDADLVSFTSSSPVLVIQMETEWSRIQFPDAAGALSGKPLVGDGRSLDVLVAFANTILDSTLDPESSGIGALRTALEACASAVAASSAAPHNRAATSIKKWDLYREAASLIIANSGDPDFHVATLSESLQVSRRRLSHAFTEADTTPTQYLRRLRALNALDLLTAASTEVEPRHP